MKCKQCNRDADPGPCWWCGTENHPPSPPQRAYTSINTAEEFLAVTGMSVEDLEKWWEETRNVIACELNLSHGFQTLNLPNFSVPGGVDQ